MNYEKPEMLVLIIDMYDVITNSIPTLDGNDWDTNDGDINMDDFKP